MMPLVMADIERPAVHTLIGGPRVFEGVFDPNVYFARHEVSSEAQPFCTSARVLDNFKLYSWFGPRPHLASVSNDSPSHGGRAIRRSSRSGTERSDKSFRGGR